MTEQDKEKFLAELKLFLDTVQGLRVEVEGFRTHLGSTGYFLQCAIEDLTKAVSEMQTRITHGA